MESTDVRRQWADRSGEYSPEFYAHYGPDESSEAVRRQLERDGVRAESVLELGCSSGRHLAHLREHGFDSLTGIEINGDAFDVMADVYPDLAAEGTFHHCGIEDVIETFDDEQFDAIYSVETLQHVHPDLDWIFAELARVTRDRLVTVENEGSAADDGMTATDASSPDGGTASPADELDVTYVDGLPLYYRDWNRVFTARGLEEVAVERVNRDTVRAFRSPDA